MYMLEACYMGATETVEEYVRSRKVLIDDCDDDGVTALQIAAARGNEKLARYCIENGANVESTNEIGFTPFLHACREGHLRILELLIQKMVKIDVMTALGTSALALAVASGKLEVVQWLVNRRAELNPRVPRLIPPTPFITAVFCGGQPNICVLLHTRGAQVYQKIPDVDLDAGTIVAMVGSEHMFKSLPDYFIDVEKINYRGKSVLALAEGHRNSPVARVIREWQSKAPRGHAPVHDFREVIYRSDTAQLQQILSKSVEVTPLSSKLTPLMYAVVMGRHDCVKILLARILSPNVAETKRRALIDAQETELGLTALMMANISRYASNWGTE
ncbi:Protein C01H6.2 [Aphelenchoides avenae]|nr:Protein C01H6.2 [Aphelenchus avenae]